MVAYYTPSPSPPPSPLSEHPSTTARVNTYRYFICRVGFWGRVVDDGYCVSCWRLVVSSCEIMLCTRMLAGVDDYASVGRRGSSVVDISLRLRMTVLIDIVISCLLPSPQIPPPSLTSPSPNRTLRCCTIAVGTSHAWIIYLASILNRRYE